MDWFARIIGGEYAERSQPKSRSSGSFGSVEDSEQAREPADHEPAENEAGGASSSIEGSPLFREPVSECSHEEFCHVGTGTKDMTPLRAVRLFFDYEGDFGVDPIGLNFSIFDDGSVVIDVHVFNSADGFRGLSDGFFRGSLQGITLGENLN